MQRLFTSLVEEGSVEGHEGATGRGWRHALDLDAASHRRRHQITSVLDVIPLDMPLAYLNHGLRTRWRYGKSAFSDGVITLSHYSARRLTSHYPRLQDRIHVVPIPVEWSSHGSDQPGTYVMSMADYRSPDVRKRLHWIPQAVRELLRAGIETRLVVRGEAPADVRNSGAVLVSDVSNDGLQTMMRDCLAFFYPSAYEGQGLPPLEAMAAGAPVIAFDNSSLSEFVPPSFLMPDPVPWARTTTTFEPMPTWAVDEIVDRARQYRGTAPDVWQRQARAALRPLSTAESLTSLRRAYRTFGVIP